jgi:hypothetical protein
MAPRNAGRLHVAFAAALAIAGTLVPAGSPLAAQVLAGTVLDATTGRGLEGAQITLMDADEAVHGTAQTDSSGRFVLRVPGPGTWKLAIGMLGYQSMVSAPIGFADAEAVAVEITLDVDAIPLEPLVVTGRRSMRSPDIQAFYDRRDRAARSGFGRFVTREDIERSPPIRATDLVRSMVGVRVVPGRGGRGAGIRMAGGCIPAIFVDGMQLNRVNRNDSLDDYVATLDIEGIEVYRGPASQLGALHDPTGCGLVAVWTRRGEAVAGGRLDWKRILITLGVIGTLFLLTN